jgi:hypothetical protein
MCNGWSGSLSCFNLDRGSVNDYSQGKNVIPLRKEIEPEYHEQSKMDDEIEPF